MKNILPIKIKTGDLHRIKWFPMKRKLSLWKVEILFYKRNNSSVYRAVYLTSKPYKHVGSTNIIVRCRMEDEIYDIVDKYIATRYKGTPYKVEVGDYERIVTNKETS